MLPVPLQSRPLAHFLFEVLGVEPPLVVAFLFVLLLRNQCVKEGKSLGRCRKCNLILVFFFYALLILSVKVVVGYYIGDCFLLQRGKTPRTNLVALTLREPTSLILGIQVFSLYTMCKMQLLDFFFNLAITD